MGSKEYTNIKRNKLLKGLLQLVSACEGLSIEEGTKHPWKLKHKNFPRRVYPLDLNHPGLHADVVEELMKVLVKNNICSKADFDRAIGKVK